MIPKKESGDKRRWKDLACFWVDRINIVKMTIVPEAIYKFNTISIKIPMKLLIKMEKGLKIHVETQKLENI